MKEENKEQEVDILTATREGHKQLVEELSKLEDSYADALSKGTDDPSATIAVPLYLVAQTISGVAKLREQNTILLGIFDSLFVLGRQHDSDAIKALKPLYDIWQMADTLGLLKTNVEEEN